MDLPFIIKTAVNGFVGSIKIKAQKEWKKEKGDLFMVKLTKKQKMVLEMIRHGGCYVTRHAGVEHFATMSENKLMPTRTVHKLIEKGMLLPLKDSMLFKELDVSIQQYEAAPL